MNSEVRYKIVKLLLSITDSSISQIAGLLELKHSTITTHLKKLLELKIVKSKKTKGIHGIAKICSLTDPEDIKKIIVKEEKKRGESGIRVVKFENLESDVVCRKIFNANLCPNCRDFNCCYSGRGRF